MKQILDYISAVPGIGKTNWAIQTMKSYFIQNSTTCIFVAPTTKLLLQVYNDLEKLLLKDGFDRFEINSRLLILTTDTKSSATIKEIVEASLKGKQDRSGMSHGHLKPGCIVFMCHEGFYNLPEDVYSQELRQNTVVIFDEVKQCVFESKKYKVKGKLVSFFKSHFEIVKKNQSYEILTLKTSRKRALKAFKEEPKFKTYDFMYELIDRVSNPLIEVFCRKSVIPTKSKAPMFSYICVTAPMKVFLNYKRVVIMSAFLEDSQMYHFLINSNLYTLRNITRQLPNYSSRMEALSERYSKVTIVPLTVQDQPLSLNALGSKILVPQEKVQSIANVIEGMGISREDFTKIRRYLNRGKIPTNTPGAYQDIFNLLLDSPDVAHIPIQWFLDSTYKLFELWQKKKGGYGQPLVFVNNRYLTKVDPSQATQLTTSSHGINMYRNSNMVAYLAATRPSPGLSAFLKENLPTYDLTKDRVLNVCLQCLARCSVRDTNSGKDVLIVLPDLALTKLVSDRMFGLPKVVVKFAYHYKDMIFYGPGQDIDTPEIKEEKNEAKKKRKAAYMSEYLQDPKKAALHRLRSSISVYKKRIESGNASDKVKATYKRKLKELKELTSA